MLATFRRLILVSLLACGLAVSRAEEANQPSFSAESFSPGQIEFFEARVRPLLVQHCFDCHSTDARQLKGGLYVDSRLGLLQGGDSGPSIVIGQPHESLLIEAVKYESLEMPPDGKLSQQQIDTFVSWVRLGAPWPQVTSSPGISDEPQQIDWEKARASHWAWQPVDRPNAPPVESGVCFNPIDNFVIAKRSAAGLSSAERSEPHVLARRIYLDLIGIPPTPEQVTAFAKAAARNQQTAVASLVDQLLDLPLYGQRWGRYWLDVARYSDGFGGFLDNQQLVDAWRYRDWVVNALNDDMPFDQFVNLQIAGDLSDNKLDAIATGFFALGPTYRSDGGDPDSVAQAKGETLDDRIDTLTRGLLAVTGSCARCHDHKFDPIPQQDYYSLAGIFNNTTVHSLPLASDAVVKRISTHNRAVSDLEKKSKALQRKIRVEEREATAEEQQQLDQWKSKLADFKKNAPSGFDTAHALKESGSVDMKVAVRGNLRQEGLVAPRRFLRILTEAEPPLFTDGSGRRELADAITDPNNPLTARVFVNRVWMHHFGEALVRTPSNFGTLGDQPTHPQLLDWLASEFIAKGWSIKSLHRLIMTSATYQMGSQFNRHAFRRDADNRLLWRMNPRRMDVEAWRDSLLTVTGELDTSSGGPPVTDITASVRRTLYAKVSRNGDRFPSDEFLRRFDFPIMRATVAQRPNSIVPQRFLFLMNSRFMIERSEAFVARLKTAADSDLERIRIAYQLLYSRPPLQSESKLALQFLGADADGEELPNWVRYAQVLLSSNEFMYVR